MMIDKSLKTLALLIIATTVMSCTQKEEYYGGSAVIGIKDEFFQDYADSVYTAGGRMATQRLDAEGHRLQHQFIRL